jgi:hypothetical protein
VKRLFREQALFTFVTTEFKVQYITPTFNREDWGEDAVSFGTVFLFYCNSMYGNGLEYALFSKLDGQVTL